MLEIRREDGIEDRLEADREKPSINIDPLFEKLLNVYDSKMREYYDYSRPLGDWNTEEEKREILIGETKTDFRLSPQQINYFLQILDLQQRTDFGWGLTGMFFGQLIQNSIAAGYNHFEFDIQSSYKTDHVPRDFCRYLEDKNKNTKVIIKGDVGYGLGANAYGIHFESYGHVQGTGIRPDNCTFTFLEELPEDFQINVATNCAFRAKRKNYYALLPKVPKDKDNKIVYLSDDLEVVKEEEC